jgi:DNA-binding PucR family transcriptional regulator
VVGTPANGGTAADGGGAAAGAERDALAETHALVRRLGLDAMAGVHGNRLVVVLGGVADPIAAAHQLVPIFGDGPIVTSPVAADVGAASAVTRAALSGLRAVAAWPAAPRPVDADALLPERALAGDADARAALIETVYRPLVAAGEVLLDTVSTFLETGGALEATARALFVHANTVRYRLRRVAEICGQAPGDPRGAFALRLALTLGRLDDAQ